MERRRRRQILRLSSTSSSSSCCKSQVPYVKCKQYLSDAPVRKGRKSRSDVMISPQPLDFAKFDYIRDCPTLLAVTNDDVDAVFSNLDKLQLELEQMLVHATDHQKKICREITFLTAGHYSSGNDICDRPMPVYMLENLNSFPSSRMETGTVWITGNVYGNGGASDTDDDDSGKINWLDESFDFWPPNDLPKKFWRFVGEYLSPMNEEYLQQWSNIIKIFGSGDCDDGPEAPPEFIPRASKKDSCNSVSKFRTQSLPRLGRHEPRTLSRLPTRMASLISDLINAYERGEKCISERKSISLRRSNEWKIKKGRIGKGDTIRHSYPNYRIENSSSTISVETLKMLDRALTDYFDKLGSDAKEYKKIRESTKVEDGKKSAASKKSGKKGGILTELKKLQAELIEKKVPLRSIVVQIWYRLLAEYLRANLERTLDEADQKLFDVYSKYFDEYPRRRPENNREREECRDALQRRNEAAQAYYSKKYASFGKCKRKHECPYVSRERKI